MNIDFLNENMSIILNITTVSKTASQSLKSDRQFLMISYLAQILKKIDIMNKCNYMYSRRHLSFNLMLHK